MDEAKEKFFQCHDDTKTAFEELCAMVDALNVSGEYDFMIKIQGSVNVHNSHVRRKQKFGVVCSCQWL